MAEWFASVKAEFELNFIKADRWEYLVTGLGNTLLLTLVALIVGVLIGIVVAAVRSTYDKTAETARPSFGRRVFGFFNGLCKVYLTVVRGTPVVVQVMIFFYVIFATAKDGTMVAALAFGINSGAYMAEIVRGGILSIDKGQFEAAHSIGMSHTQTMRSIILPQVIRNILPATGNEFVINIKDTSVLNVISVSELFFQSKTIAANNYRYFEVFFVTCVLYFIMTFTITRILRLIERKMDGKETYTIHGSQTALEGEIKVVKKND